MNNDFWKGVAIASAFFFWTFVCFEVGKTVADTWHARHPAINDEQEQQAPARQPFSEPQVVPGDCLAWSAQKGYIFIPCPMN